MNEIRRKAQVRALDARAIDRIVWSEEFETAWEVATDIDKSAFRVYFEKADRTAIAAWVKKQIKSGLPGKSLRELRLIARHQGVANYHALNKDALLVELGGAS